jgi:hypothetical protein
VLASKKEYFYGLKLCLIVTEGGKLVEMLLTPGATWDIAALRSMELNLPDDSTLLADKGFLDTVFETFMAEHAHLHLVAPRRRNRKQPLAPCLEYVLRVRS